MNVVASGTALSYQWQKNGTNVISVTKATYIISNAQTADAGNYSVVVSNSAGIITTTGALLSVDPFQITNLAIHTNDVLITWTTTGGQTNIVQATADLTRGFTNVSATMFINGTGTVSTNFLDTGAVTNLAARFYRVQMVQ